MANKITEVSKTAAAANINTLEKPVVVSATIATPVAVPPVIMASKPVVATVAPAAVAPAASTATIAVAAPAAAARVEVSRDRSTIVALIAKLRDCDAEAARDAATTLGNLPADAGAVEALSAVVANKDGFFHAVVRTSAATSLGKIGDRKAVDALIIGIGDTMAEASEEAVKALGKLGDTRALASLEAVVRNDSGFYLETVRKTAEAAVALIKRK